MMDRVTSAVIDTGRLNESATRPATPAASTARVRVTQSAGWMDGWSLRIRAATSSAAAAEPVTSPAIQPATASPAVADTTPSRTAVASSPRIDARRIAVGASAPADLAALACPHRAGEVVRSASSSAGLVARIVPPSLPVCRRSQRGNGSAVTQVHSNQLGACDAAGRRLNYVSSWPV